MALLACALGCSTSRSENPDRSPKAFASKTPLTPTQRLDPSDADLRSDFPVIDGTRRINERWSVRLPRKFNVLPKSSLDDLVLWRPGFTAHATVRKSMSIRPGEDWFTSIERAPDDKRLDFVIEKDGPLRRLSFLIPNVTKEYCTVLSAKMFAEHEGRILTPSDFATDTECSEFISYVESGDEHVELVVYFAGWVRAPAAWDAYALWRGISESAAK